MWSTMFISANLFYLVSEENVSTLEGSESSKKNLGLQQKFPNRLQISKKLCLNEFGNTY